MIFSLNKNFISSCKTCSDDYIYWIQRIVAATARYVSASESFAFPSLQFLPYVAVSNYSGIIVADFLVNPEDILCAEG